MTKVIVITCLWNLLTWNPMMIKWIDFENIYPDDQIKYMSSAHDTNILTFDISFICSVEKRILLFFLVWISSPVADEYLYFWTCLLFDYPALYMFLNFPFGFQIFVFVKPINKHKRMRKPFLHFWCQGIKNDRFLQNAGRSFYSLKEEYFHNLTMIITTATRGEVNYTTYDVGQQILCGPSTFFIREAFNKKTRFFLCQMAQSLWP